MLVPYPSPAVGSNVPDGFTLTWAGWDGSSWDLTGVDVDGVLLGAGVRGMHMPAVQRYASESPSVDGSRWRGRRTAEREVFWPLWVQHGARGQSWVDLDRAWWRTMDPDRPGLWTVTQPSGESRSLLCRWTSGADGFEMDPALVGWASYEVYLVAEDPYWQGTPVVRSWAPAAPVDFFDTAGDGAPPFHLSSSVTLETATMSNPGDVEAWPVWRIDGPTTTVEVGAGGTVVEVPFAIADGDSLTIDARPSAQTAVLADGTDVTDDLGAVGFAPIAAGAAVALSLDMVGAGVVTCSLTPRYYRAW